MNNVSINVFVHMCWWICVPECLSWSNGRAICRISQFYEPTHVFQSSWMSLFSCQQYVWDHPLLYIVPNTWHCRTLTFFAKYGWLALLSYHGFNSPFSEYWWSSARFVSFLAIWISSYVVCLLKSLTLLKIELSALWFVRILYIRLNHMKSLVFDHFDLQKMAVSYGST